MDRRRAHVIVAYGVAALSLVVALTGSAYAAGQVAGAAAARQQLCIVTDKANGGQILDCDPYVAPTTSPTSSSTATPAPSATTTPSPSSSPTPSPTTSGPRAFPTAATTGVPAGWTPTVTYTSGLTITSPGVYENFRVLGTLNVRAAGVTVRRAEVVGGIIDNENAGRCYNGLVLEDVTVRDTVNANGAVQPGGYTARRVELSGVTEGFRVGGASDAGCTAVTIEDSYVRAVPPPGCGDWHGDALQGYDAPPLTIRNSTLILAETSSCGGTSAYFYPAGQAAATIDRLLVSGGGYVFRSDSPVSVRGLRIVDRTWGYGPIESDVTCRRVTLWQDNAISDATGNVVRSLPTC